MNNKLTICAALLALGLGGIGVAKAQPIYVGPRYYDAGVAPYEIMRIVRASGLAPLSRPLRRGPTYVLVAADRSGGSVRVVVHAYSGQILSVRPVIAMNPYGPQLAAPYDRPPGVLPPPSRFDELSPLNGPRAGFDGGVPPVPPRPMPNARVANAPNAAPLPPIAAPQPQPARTPIPRPRPNVASNDTETTPTTPLVLPASPPVNTQAAPAAVDKAVTPAKSEGTSLVPVAPLE